MNITDHTSELHAIDVINTPEIVAPVLSSRCFYDNRSLAKRRERKPQALPLQMFSQRNNPYCDLR